MIGIDDTGAPEVIRSYVRAHPDIEVKAYIKQGFIGEVYFAKRKKLGDDVVLKFYLSTPGYDASEEAVILKSIDHPNILKVYDLRFVPPDYAYFLSPLIAGGDLQTHIDVDSFSTRDSLHILSNILTGVNELHAVHSLVHRDLKCGNVLMDFINRRAIVADLGAVKKINEANGFVTASKATKLYLPPESIIADKYFFQSDLYQIGLIMFQLLGGFFPVSDQLKLLTLKEQAEILKIRNSIDRGLKFDQIIDKKIKKGAIVNIATLPLYLDSQFKKVISKAIHVDYTKRYSTASEFMKAVHTLERKFPDCHQLADYLSISHENGKAFKIYQGKKGDYIVEKTVNGSTWRKDNNHNGKYESALDLAKKG